MEQRAHAGALGKLNKAQKKTRRKEGPVSWRAGLYSIHSLILVSFTVVSVLLTLLLSLSLYSLFMRRTVQVSIDSTNQLLKQTTLNLEDYLVSMRRMSDAMYYDVIKNVDLADSSVDGEMNLIYEAHKDNLVSIALYTNSGHLISASPNATEKRTGRAKSQEWFSAALDMVENLHFSTPHVQNLFEDSSYRYHWVISLSRAVEITMQGHPQMGVLLVDMNYSTIQHMLERINQDSGGQYTYLTDREGAIIYHPRQMQIATGVFQENNTAAAAYDDGVHNESFLNKKRTVVVNTVSYTGWKLISVIPEESYHFTNGNIRNLVVMLVAIALLILMILNQIISSRVSLPLTRLNESIRELESGSLIPEEIYIGGTQEVAHLGATLKQSVIEINRLMDDIVVEQEEKRKTEMDALQSQINPHFLYNTLDSIVWMIEGEHNREAVFMVTQLASLFRISLSRGKNIIPLEQELKHAENYMNIQKVRYKNRFRVVFEVDSAINSYATVKLLIQPILENAIYYGMEGMDEEDGGEIRIQGKLQEGEIILRVVDNGFGMPEETVKQLLQEQPEGAPVKPKHGSGVGLINVHKRIQLRFGTAYGLRIESEPDVGTCVTICLPAVPCNEENRELLEHGRYPKKNLQEEVP